MKKVVKLDNYRDVNMWKIEGDAFKEVKILSAEMDKAKKEATKIVEAAHKKLWARIEEETGSDCSLQLDIEYENLGFYVVKKCEGRDGLKGLLDALKS